MHCRVGLGTGTHDSRHVGSSNVKHWEKEKTQQIMEMGSDERILYCGLVWRKSPCNRFQRGAAGLLAVPCAIFWGTGGGLQRGSLRI